MVASTVVTPIRLYPLYCTLYYCTLTRRQPSAPVTLSSAFVIYFCFKFCSVHSIGYNFHSSFRLQFRSEINIFPNSFFFLLEVSRELSQCLTLNTSLIALVVLASTTRYMADLERKLRAHGTVGTGTKWRSIFFFTGHHFFVFYLLSRFPVYFGYPYQSPEVGTISVIAMLCFCGIV